MVPYLYLYEPPFVVSNTIRHRQEHVIESLTDNDRDDERSIRHLLTKFAAENKLIVSEEDHTVIFFNQDTFSWEYKINSINFRSLIVMEQYASLLSSLRNNRQHPINKIIDLHSRLGALFDHKLLNTLCHRTLSSIELIPYDAGDGASVSWKTIHQETPFIWILVLLQIVIRSTAIQSI